MCRVYTYIWLVVMTWASLATEYTDLYQYCWLPYNCNMLMCCSDSEYTVSYIPSFIMLFLYDCVHIILIISLVPTVALAGYLHGYKLLIMLQFIYILVYNYKCPCLHVKVYKIKLCFLLSAYYVLSFGCKCGGHIHGVYVRTYMYLAMNGS